MRILRVGLQGPDVQQWQSFLSKQGFGVSSADGVFGKQTEAATIEFQKKYALGADGVVGPSTVRHAIVIGYQAEGDSAYPEMPGFAPLVSNAQREALFGKFEYVSKPVPGNAENIVITGGWQQENIVAVPVPQLIGITGAPQSGKVWFHKKGAAQLAALWADWAEAGLIDRVVTWGGSFVPRFVRGSRTNLSNHSFGTAFDINAAENMLGAEPARLGAPGCVRELVPLAHKHGFYWGGHFSGSRRDGMHFEVAVLR